MNHVCQPALSSPRSRHLPTLFLLALASFACSTGTESVSGPSDPGDPDGGRKSTKSGTIGTIQVVNKTPNEGVGIAEVVLPLSAGQYTSAPNIRTEFDQVCQVFPMGAPHEDGDRNGEETALSRYQ